MTCTIYENIYAKEPHYITVDNALTRIRNGNSRQKVESIRNAMDKENADALKRQLPSVCFSGKFNERHDSKIIEHTGYLVMDFDNVQDVGELIATLAGKDFIYAAWLSPSGNGVKALARIADGKRHRQHFEALKRIFPDIDKSGINESRVCYESFDPHMYVNEKAVPFTQFLETERIEAKEVVGDEADIFKKLLKWITNKGDAFVKGERNTYIFKLAASCCRFGINEDNAARLIGFEYPTSSDFTHKECVKAIQSAYKANSGKYGSCQFEKDILVDKTTRKEVVLPTIDIDSAEVQDVIYGSMVKKEAMNVYYSGYPNVAGIDVPILDKHFKARKGEITCMSGIGNYGKSTYYKWFILMHVLKFGEKFAAFPPEDKPAWKYYLEFVEMLLGCDCTPKNPNRPSFETYSNAYDFVSAHIFYIYPKDLIPSPDHIKQRFLELIIKEKVDGVCIDPFNQLSHDYSISGGRSDKYLETVLGDFGRFAVTNNVYFFIIMHPVKMKKEGAQNYPCPDVFDLADGAMWNNKMDNIIIYHRPYAQTDPSHRACEFHSKKIRDQKIVGEKGFFEFEYNRQRRRYEIEGTDYMSDLLRINNLDFTRPVQDYIPTSIKPMKPPVVETHGDNLYQEPKNEFGGLKEPPFK